jgi:hypothetical protein
VASDLSPLLPAQLNVYFRGRRCSGNPSDTTPTWYTSSVSLSNITFTDTAISPIPLGVSGATAIVHDAAVALYAAGGSTPTNKTALDNLAKQIAQDFYDYRSESFDLVYNGIVNPLPNGLIDVAEFYYGTDDQWTRVQSVAWSGEPEEYQHQDPAVSGCMDANNAGNPVAKVPCVEYIGDPVTCTGGGGKATATISNGKITGIAVTAGGTYTSTPTVAISGDGSGATASATVSGGAVSSVVIENQGSGYSSAIVSFSGGGSKLQMTRYKLCLEDGRLVTYFIQYESIG